MTPEILTHVADAVRRAERILFVTGAGVSADSGLPTYRGVGGLYDGDDTDDGVPIEVALSGGMLRSRPEVAWKHIAAIEAACRGAEPNDAHRAIRAIEDRHPGTWVLTQNVDGLHHRAGSRNVIAIHGDIHRLSCTRCTWRATVPDYAGLRIPPTCPECGAVVRPDVVLFGEALPGPALATLRRELHTGFDLVFSVGTSSLFPYIVEPVVLAHRRGRPVVEINPSRTDVSHAATWRLEAGAAEAFRAILARL